MKRRISSRRGKMGIYSPGERLASASPIHRESLSPSVDKPLSTLFVYPLPKPHQPLRPATDRKPPLNLDTADYPGV